MFVRAFVYARVRTRLYVCVNIRTFASLCGNTQELLRSAAAAAALFGGGASLSIEYRHKYTVEKVERALLQMREKGALEPDSPLRS